MTQTRRSVKNEPDARPYGGRSRVPDELVAAPDLAVAVDVLSETLLRLATAAAENFEDGSEGR